MTVLVKDVRAVREPATRRITMALAAIRSNRMDWAVEKLTELGIGTIQPLYTEYTDIRSIKKHHLEKITVSAIKQSRQAWLPRLNDPQDWQTFTAAAQGTCVLAHLDAAALPFSGQSFPAAPASITIAIGPEGGFSATELETAGNRHFRTVRLSETLLRTETAAITAFVQIKLLLS